MPCRNLPAHAHGPTHDHACRRYPRRARGARVPLPGMLRSAEYSWNALKPPPVKCQQALPVPLGGRLVETPASGKGEAVVDARVYFELALGAGEFEETAQFVDHRQWREFVMLGT